MTNPNSSAPIKDAIPDRIFSPAEVAQHKTPPSLWITLDSTVYDITPLLSSHPGGPTPLLTHAGTDASQTFHILHPSDTLPEAISTGQVIPLGTTTSTPAAAAIPTPPTPPPDLPALDSLLSLHAFSKTAKKVLPEKAWAYYNSSSDDTRTFRLNAEIWERIFLRPRMLRDVRECDTRTKLLGMETSMPVFVSPCAQARLAHPSGETGIAAAAGKKGVIYIVSNNASMTVEEVAFSGGTLWWQLYVQEDRTKSEKMLARIAKAGYKAVVLTVDAPVPGKREEDQAVGGVGKQLFQGTTAGLVWGDLGWLRERTKLPAVLKGLQTWEDVVLAAEHGVQAVILSNHGGRAMDTAPPGVMVLMEVQRYAPWVFGRMEVYLDGGVRRGTDVLKALALGASAVGVGRPALYGLSGYGAEGVERVLDILHEEITTGVRLLGETNIPSIQNNPRCVNAQRLIPWIWTPSPKSHL